MMMARICGTFMKPHRPMVDTLHTVMSESIKRDIVAEYPVHCCKTNGDEVYVLPSGRFVLY